MRSTLWTAFLMATLETLSAADPNTAARKTGEPSPAAVRQACKQLFSVKEFAFGGVGFAGTTSVGEQAYRTLISSTNSLALFQSALVKGGNEAKLYALAAIRHLDRKSFDAAAKPLLAANPEVATMSGCIVRREKAETLIKRIAGGLYDNWTGKTAFTVTARPQGR